MPESNNPLKKRTMLQRLTHLLKAGMMPLRQIHRIPQKLQWKLLLQTELITPVKRMKSLKKEKPAKRTQEKMLPKNKDGFFQGLTPGPA